MIIVSCFIIIILILFCIIMNYSLLFCLVLYDYSVREVIATPPKTTLCGPAKPLDISSILHRTKTALMFSPGT